MNLTKHQAIALARRGTPIIVQTQLTLLSEAEETTFELVPTPRGSAVAITVFLSTFGSLDIHRDIDRAKSRVLDDFRQDVALTHSNTEKGIRKLVPDS